MAWITEMGISPTKPKSRSTTESAFELNIIFTMFLTVGVEGYRATSWAYQFRLIVLPSIILHVHLAALKASEVSSYWYDSGITVFNMYYTRSMQILPYHTQVAFSNRGWWDQGSLCPYLSPLFIIYWLLCSINREKRKTFNSSCILLFFNMVSKRDLLSLGNDSHFLHRGP